MNSRHNKLPTAGEQPGFLTERSFFTVVYLKKEMLFARKSKWFVIHS